jgi:beta-barrel assembly-enhancing protease
MNPRAWIAFAILAASPWVPLAVLAETPVKADVYAVLERARQALQADQYVEAGQAIDQALQMPEFAEADQSVQFRAFLFAAFAADGRDDNLGAHEFMAIATEFPDADSQHWMFRAQFAAQVEAWADAGLAIATIAKRWPTDLAKVNNELVGRTAFMMKKDSRLGAERQDLLNALFAAHYTNEWGTEPSSYWKDLIVDALARNDLALARDFSARITDAETLIALHIDKRFDALVEAEPRGFEVRPAAEREVKRLRNVVDQNPRSLGALVQYGYAMLEVGQFAELVKLSDKTISRAENASIKSPPYDDASEQLNWIYDNKFRALRALGRWDEALAVLESGRMKRERGSGNVSQAINLGGFYIELGRPDEALKSLDGIDWAHSLSGYGRMQLQHVRYCAYLQLHSANEADKVFAYLRENKDDAPDTWQDVMLDSGDMDGAAALLISRLHDVKERDAALASVQMYSKIIEPPKTAEARKRRDVLLARDDVRAAIDAVGRRAVFAVYSLNY